MASRTDILEKFEVITDDISTTYIAENKGKTLEVYVYKLEPDYLWRISKGEEILEEGCYRYDQKLTMILRKLWNMIK